MISNAELRKRLAQETLKDLECPNCQGHNLFLPTFMHVRVYLDGRTESHGWGESFDSVQCADCTEENMTVTIGDLDEDVWGAIDLLYKSKEGKFE